MIHWWAFPLFFTLMSMVVGLLAMLADYLTNRHAGQLVAHTFAWMFMVAINLAIWLIWVVIYR